MGMHGWKHVNRAIQSADLLFAIGMRFDDRVTGNVRTYAPYARIVHVDIDPAEIGKNVAVEVPIVGDAGRVLARAAADGRGGRPGDPGRLLRRAGRVAARVRGLVVARLRRLARRPPLGRLRHQRIGELTDHEATYVADVGQNQMWLARYAGFRQPNSHVSSGGLGTMGFSVPAAMGAALGAPDRETWAITGDGGFQMTSQELMTLVQDEIPVKIALLRQQEARDDPAVAGDHLRGQLPLGPPARARTTRSSPTRTASRRSGPRRPTRSTTRSGPPRRSTARRSSGSRSPRSRTSSR